MIGTIRKHSGWLWAIIITVTIITFVFWGSQTSRFGDRGGRANFGTINGERVTTEKYLAAAREVQLRFFLNYGEWPDSTSKRTGFDQERETYFRLLLIQKMNDLGIHVSSEAAAQTASQFLLSFGRGTPVPLDAFVRQILLPHGLSLDDFERFIRHELGLQQLAAVTGMSGYLITPQEARELYVREHEDLSAEVVFFSASNYLGSVTVRPEAVSQFYTNQLALFRLPERVQVSYVAFSVSNFLAQAEQELMKTNLAEIIEANYRRLGTNYFRDMKSPEEAKEKIRRQLIRQRALRLGGEKANDFVSVLFTNDPPRAENLDTLAKEKGLVVHVTAPFDREFGPKDMAVGPDFAKRAFARTADEPLDGPIVGEDAVYVIALTRRLPSEIPALEKIRDHVTANYKYSEAVLLARKAGSEFYMALTNGLAQRKSFSTVCVEKKVRPIALPPFSLSTRELPEVEDHISLTQFKQITYPIPSGKPSPYIPTRDGGFVAFVQTRLPMDEAKLKADMPAFMNAVRQRRESEAFNEWFRTEVARGLRDTPVARPAQAQMAGTPAK